jgi:hypothetical protein
MTIHMKVYPVFKPNEYFWKNHFDEKSGFAKWDLYSKVVREDIMAKSFDFELSNAVMADKMDYKALLKGKLPREKKDN